jgi:hypothetical protein
MVGPNALGTESRRRRALSTVEKEVIDRLAMVAGCVRNTNRLGGHNDGERVKPHLSIQDLQLVAETTPNGRRTTSFCPGENPI